MTTGRSDTISPELPGVTILLVDDEPAVLKIAELMLRAEGHRVITASDGREALRLCHEKGDSLELLISDVKMPGMSGIELVECAAGLLNTPVILMSGHLTGGDVEKEFQAKGIRVDFLQKPFTVAALRRVISGAMNRGSAAGSGTGS